MRCLVTLADCEPYWTGAAQLRYAANRIGFGFAECSSCRGDLPWQAKRFAVRHGFQEGAERVFWCDSDVTVRDPWALGALVNREGRDGLWVHHPIDLESYWQRLERHNGPDVATRARVLHRRLCLDLGIGETAPHSIDWFIGYVMPPALGLRLCDVWDWIAKRLSEEQLTWSDGVSIGIAAKACGVPVRTMIRGRDLRRALVHAKHGQATGYLPGELRP